MSRLTRDGTAEPVSRDQIIRRERGQGNIHCPCSADHEQDWQLYPVIHTLAVCVTKHVLLFVTYYYCKWPIKKKKKKCTEPQRFDNFPPLIGWMLKSLDALVQIFLQTKQRQKSHTMDLNIFWVWNRLQILVNRSRS